MIPRLVPALLHPLPFTPTRPRPRQQPGQQPAALLGVPYRDGELAIPRPAGAPYRPDPDKVGRGV
jgi:hypothetical protein